MDGQAGNGWPVSFGIKRIKLEKSSEVGGSPRRIRPLADQRSHHGGQAAVRGRESSTKQNSGSEVIFNCRGSFRLVPRYPRAVSAHELFCLCPADVHYRVDGLALWTGFTRCDELDLPFVVIFFFPFLVVVVVSSVVGDVVGLLNLVLASSAVVRPNSEFVKPCELIWLSPGLFIGPNPFGPPVPPPLWPWAITYVDNEIKPAATASPNFASLVSFIIPLHCCPS